MKVLNKLYTTVIGRLISTLSVITLITCMVLFEYFGLGLLIFLTIIAIACATIRIIDWIITGDF